MKFVKMLLALVGLALVFKFSLDNPLPVTVKFHTYLTPEIPLFLLLVSTFILGMIAASFASSLKILQLKRQLRQAGTAPKKESAGSPSQSQPSVAPASTVKAAAAPVAEAQRPVAEVRPAAEALSPAADEQNPVADDEFLPDEEPSRPAPVIELPAGPVDEPSVDDDRPSAGAHNTDRPA